MITDETKAAFEDLFTRYELAIDRAIKAESLLAQIGELPYWKRFKHLNNLIFKFTFEDKVLCPYCGRLATEKESGAISCTTAGCPYNLDEKTIW